jgi:tRNA (guanine-N7-)-methyltransferase
VRLSWPADWETIFGRAAPLLVEIGFGDGEFLLKLAGERPEDNFLGLEISLPSIRKAERKITRSGLSNVRVIQSQAETTLWALCAPGDVRELFINFPDPWPKPGHHHRRLINGRFLHLAATRMSPGAFLTIATDHDGYADWILAELVHSPYYNSRFPAPYTTEDKERLRTKYELKALAEGQSCRYFKWQRSQVPAPDDFLIPAELFMPHAIVTVPLTLDEVSHQFEPQTWSKGPISVRLNELYRSQYHEAVVVDLYVHEEPLAQRILITITRRREEDYLIHLHEVGFPRPTPGVHFAVYHLAHWLAGLHPEGKVVSQKLSLRYEV